MIWFLLAFDWLGFVLVLIAIRVVVRYLDALVDVLNRHADACDPAAADQLEPVR